jgi:hypothetical protein
MTTPRPYLPILYLPILLLPLVVACQQQKSPQTPADRQAVATCRAEVDRTYTAQNRGDLSRREDYDDPFAAGYTSGIVTRGLSAQYQRDNMLQDCLNASGQPTAPFSPGEGGAFNPARN